MSSLETLLTPSLTGTQLTRPMYSIGAHVVVAFIGGPIGIFLFALYSIYYAGQLARYRFWYVLFFLLVVGSQYWLGWVSVYGLPAWFPFADGSINPVKVGNRLISLLLMGVTYLLERELFAISELKGDPPSPWIPGIAGIVVGILLSILTVAGVSAYVQ